jgi:hypothetical protein
MITNLPLAKFKLIQRIFIKIHQANIVDVNTIIDLT